MSRRASQIAPGCAQLASDRIRKLSDAAALLAKLTLTFPRLVVVTSMAELLGAWAGCRPLLEHLLRVGLEAAMAWWLVLRHNNLFGLHSYYYYIYRESI